jgi:hypothetical protein
LYVPVAPPQAVPEPASDIEEQAPGKRRRAFFPATRGDHIRFIIVVLAILLFEMFFLGFLSSKGVLEIGFFHLFQN